MLILCLFIFQTPGFYPPREVSIEFSQIYYGKSGSRTLKNIKENDWHVYFNISDEVTYAISLVGCGFNGLVLLEVEKSDLVVCGGGET